MQTLRIASNIIDLMNRQMLASSNNHYKQVLRSLLNTFGGLYYVDGNGKKVKIKCSTGRMERAKGKDFQDNTLILPYISIFERGTINDDQRRRYTPVLVNEVVWDPEEMRAKRYLSLAPRPVTISYDINVWTKYVEDMDIIRSTILSLFNPDLEIETEENEYIKAFFDSEGDLESEEQDDTADRIIKKRFSITVETYIKSPKILYTNTSQITTQNNEIVITGEGRKNGRPGRKYIDRGTNLGVINLTLSDFLNVYSDTYNLGTLNLSLSSSLTTEYFGPDDVDVSLDTNDLSLSTTLSHEYVDPSGYAFNLGVNNLILSDSLTYEAPSISGYDYSLSTLDLQLSTILSTEWLYEVSLGDDNLDVGPMPDSYWEDLNILNLELSTTLSHETVLEITLSGPHPSSTLPDFGDESISLGALNLSLSSFFETDFITSGQVELSMETLDLSFSSVLDHEFVFEIPLLSDHPSSTLPDQSWVEDTSSALGVLNIDLTTLLSYEHGYDINLMEGDFGESPNPDAFEIELAGTHPEAPLEDE